MNVGATFIAAKLIVVLLPVTEPIPVSQGENSTRIVAHTGHLFAAFVGGVDCLGCNLIGAAEAAPCVCLGSEREGDSEDEGIKLKFESEAVSSASSSRIKIDNHQHNPEPALTASTVYNGSSLHGSRNLGVNAVVSGSAAPTIG
ncbi:hypothetical protein BJ165DRAFT_1524018 [Panaeolus papilionaceus]|nr:hypothetical protein BJ165DRAFT_1524018 [Panaeolus papilionaceus]